VGGDDEELRAVGVRTRVRHREGAADDLVVVELVLELVAGPARPVALRAAALDHEVGDDAVEAEPVVEARGGELREVLGRLRRLAGKELDLDRAFAGVERRVCHAGTVATPSEPLTARQHLAVPAATYTGAMTSTIEPAGPGSIEPTTLVELASSEESRELAASWRKLTRAATIVALLTAPALFAYFLKQNDWPVWKALLVTFVVRTPFPGFADPLSRRLIRWPSLFGLESEAHREEDVLGRRRAWFWHFWLRLILIAVFVITVVWIFQGGSWTDAAVSIWDGIV